MKLIYIFVFTLVGCVSNYGDGQKKNDAESTVQSNHKSEDDVSDPELPYLLKIHECIPDVFMANEIPSGYTLDPNCPPEIIWPPKYIPPYDPGPIIQNGT